VAIDPHALQPLGFKILLETLVRHEHLQISEVPMHFAPRHSGSSKADVAKGLTYVKHLLLLRTALWRQAVHISPTDIQESHRGPA
jgi:dolichol-phosphate mannosyltransferase